MRKRSSTARAGLGKPQSPRRAAMTTDRRTLPLALSPVNQIVTPFWLSRDARSSAFTEPVHPRPDQSRLAPRSLHREQAGLTGVESDVGRHLTQFLHEKRVRGELKKTGEEERAACAIMVCRQGV